MLATICTVLTGAYEWLCSSEAPDIEDCVGWWLLNDCNSVVRALVAQPGTLGLQLLAMAFHFLIL